MSNWTPRAPRSNWRDYLTVREQRDLECIETEMSALKKRRAELSAKRYPIQNRAIQRSKFAAKRRTDGA